jgi:ribosomal protein L20
MRISGNNFKYIGFTNYINIFNDPRFIAGLKKNKIEINRKILAELAQNHPEIFEKILETIKK